MKLPRGARVGRPRQGIFMPGGMLMPGMFGFEGMGFFAAGLAAGFTGALIACSFGGAPVMVAVMSIPIPVPEEARVASARSVGSARIR